MTAMITIIPQLSETFMLDGIPHIKMTLTVAAPSDIPSDSCR